MSNDKLQLTFPPGAVSEGALRVPLLSNTADYFAMNKPAGVNAFQERSLGGGANNLIGDIRSRIAAGAGQFARLGIPEALPVNLPSREASGVMLCAKNPEAKAALRNAMGSSQFQFEYHFLVVEAPPDGEALECDLPVAADRAGGCAYASRKAGKKTVTSFQKLAAAGPCSLWRSLSPYDRFHQVRLHAAETGLRLLGESLYRPGSRSKKGGDRPPAYPPSEGIYLHLFRLTLELGGQTQRLEAPYPDDFTEKLRLLKRPRESRRGKIRPGTSKKG